MSKGSIPKILSDALSVSFDNAIGHDLFDDADARFEFYNRAEEKIPFRSSYLNKVTKGGVPRKTLNCFIAACVTPDTKVKVRVKAADSSARWVGLCEVSIGDIEHMLSFGQEVQVESPDGWVNVSAFIDKGEEVVWTLTLSNGDVIKSSAAHLYETQAGWLSAAEIYQVQELQNRHMMFLTRDGYIDGVIEQTGIVSKIVDITVDHENHRYYTSTVSSHNSGVGKSMVMCDDALYKLEQGLNVLYITLEMAEERIAERIDANMLDVTVDRLSEMPKEEYTRRMTKARAKIAGKLIIKEYPTAAASASHFRFLLNDLKLKKSFTPDVVYVDYLNICASARVKAGSNINSYTIVKSIAEELRGLAVEFNIPIITATQTNRGGYDNSDIDMTDTSESIGLPMTLDTFFALISTEELERQGQLMIKQLKNRFGPIDGKNKRFLVGIDRSKMRVFDLEDSETKACYNEPEPAKTGFGSQATVPKGQWAFGRPSLKSAGTLKV